MLLFILILAIIVNCLVPYINSQALSEMSDDHKPLIYLIGDSITQQSFSSENKGWGASLADLYVRCADVVNRGYSGYNTRWMLELVKKILPSDSINTRIELVTLWLGANDAVDAVDTQHVPLSEYKKNTIQILNHIKLVAPSAAVILITPADVDNARWATRNTAQVMQYAEEIRNIGKERDVMVVDLWAGEDAVNIDDLNDGLHLGVEGNRKVFDRIKEVLQKNQMMQLPDENDYNACASVFHFPGWRELVGQSPAEAVAQVANWKRKE